MLRHRDLIVAISLFITTSEASAEYLDVGRYLSLSSTVTENQQTLSLAPVTHVIPPQVISIGKAVRFLSESVGWGTVDETLYLESDEVKTLFAHRLPMIHRDLVGVPVEEALKAIAGPAYQLVLDPVERKVSYRLRDEYKL